MFNKNKTKWKPLYCYTTVAFHHRKMIFARYDTKTGLFDFQTKTITKDMYSTEEFDIKLNPQEVFEKLQECE